METLLDKAILILCSFLFVLEENGTTQIIAAFFAAIILTCIQEYHTEKTAIWGTCIAYCLLIPVFPVMAYFVPIVLYSAVYCKEIVPVAAGAALFVWGSTQIFGLPILAALALLLVGALLAMHSSKYHFLKKMYTAQSDDSRELELALKEKNRMLLERKDYEVHVATLAERNRIAREIHDNVGHMLSRSIIQVGALELMNKNDPTHEQLLKLQDTLNDAMDNIRESVHDLHDDAIDVGDKIRSMIADFAQYEVSFDYGLPDQTPREIKYCFLAVVKEGFSNVIHHSDADKIRIAIREYRRFYQLLFEDNGTRQEAGDGSGIGLQNMKQRVDMLGGVMHITQDAGYKIVITIPKEWDKGTVPLSQNTERGK